MSSRTAIIAAILLLADVPLAAAVSGTATLTGTLKLAVPGCGRERDSFSGSVVTGDDGRWTVAGDADDDPDDDVVAGGTYTVAGTSGRKLLLALDAPTLASLATDAEDDLAMKCGTSTATITSSESKKMQLVLNRKGTKAKLTLRMVFEGTANGRTRSVKYKVVGHGPWTGAVP